MKFCKNVLITIKSDGNRFILSYNCLSSCSYLENCTAVKGEEEILLACGSVFEILSIEFNGKYYEIELEHKKNWLNIIIEYLKFNI